MPCYKPTQAWQTRPGDPVNFKGIGKPLKLPCGGCIGCRADRSKGWAIRCMHEAQLHELNCFVTLTYNDAHLPENGQLVYSDFQEFMHRLRAQHRRDQLTLGVDKEHLKPVRFYMAGEYGDQNERPHFHAALFGVDFPDRQYHTTSPSGARVDKSAALAKLWGKGYASVGDLTFESAAYIARYVMKKRTGKQAMEHYSRTNLTTGEIYQLTPEFNRMSLKPGIGGDWWDQNKDDVYKGGTHYEVVMNGRKHKPPRYYDLRFKKESPCDWEPIAQEREVRAKESPDNTPERLRDREIVDTAKLKQLKRGKLE